MAETFRRRQERDDATLFDVCCAQPPVESFGVCGEIDTTANDGTTGVCTRDGLQLALRVSEKEGALRGIV